MQHHLRKWRGRAVRPHGVDGVNLNSHQRCFCSRTRLLQPLGAIGCVQPWIKAKLLSGFQMFLKPGLGRAVDQMLRGEDIHINLLAHLYRVAAIDENGGLIGQYNGHAP